MCLTYCNFYSCILDSTFNNSFLHKLKVTKEVQETYIYKGSLGNIVYEFNKLHKVETTLIFVPIGISAVHPIFSITHSHVQLSDLYLIHRRCYRI